MAGMWSFYTASVGWSVWGVETHPKRAPVASYTSVHRPRRRVCMSVHPDSETDGFQMRSDHEAIGCAAIDQEETFPGRVGFFWIAYVH